MNSNDIYGLVVLITFIFCILVKGFVTPQPIYSGECSKPPSLARYKKCPYPSVKFLNA